MVTIIKTDDDGLAQANAYIEKVLKDATLLSVLIMGLRVELHITTKKRVKGIWISSLYLTTLGPIAVTESMSIPEVKDYNSNWLRNRQEIAGPIVGLLAEDVEKILIRRLGHLTVCMGNKFIHILREDNWSEDNLYEEHGWDLIEGTSNPWAKAFWRISLTEDGDLAVTVPEELR